MTNKLISIPTKYVELIAGWIEINSEYEEDPADEVALLLLSETMQDGNPYFTISDSDQEIVFEHMLEGNSHPDAVQQLCERLSVSELLEILKRDRL